MCRSSFQTFERGLGLRNFVIMENGRERSMKRNLYYELLLVSSSLMSLEGRIKETIRLYAECRYRSFPIMFYASVITFNKSVNSHKQCLVRLNFSDTIF